MRLSLFHFYGRVNLSVLFCLRSWRYNRKTYFRRNPIGGDHFWECYHKFTSVFGKDPVFQRNPVISNCKFRNLALDFLILFALNTGQSKANPAVNCKDLKHKAPSLVSGVYWIDPDGGSHGNAFQAYCDQNTDGGGWTLVWSYSFTAYSSFMSPTNAVTPRPSWTASGHKPLQCPQQFL